MSGRHVFGLVALGAVFATLSACHHGAKPAGAPAAAKASVPKTPPEVTPAAIKLGDSLFNSNGACQRCHGKMGTGGKNGPDLTIGPFQHSKGSYAEILSTIMTGVPKAELKDPTRPFPMSARGGGRAPFTDDQVKAVAAYVYSISRNKK